MWEDRCFLRRRPPDPKRCSCWCRHSPKQTWLYGGDRAWLSLVPSRREIPACLGALAAVVVGARRDEGGSLRCERRSLSRFKASQRLGRPKSQPSASNDARTNRDARRYSSGTTEESGRRCLPLLTLPLPRCRVCRGKCACRGKFVHEKIGDYRTWRHLWRAGDVLRLERPVSCAPTDPVLDFRMRRKGWPRARGGT